MQLTPVDYAGWKNCLQLSNDCVELVIPLDVGPRIISYKRKNGPNVFKNYDSMMGVTQGEEWMIFGGHRLWHAPEDAVRTYAPDFDPVAHEWDGRVLTLTPPPEAGTGLQKSICLELAPGSSQVTVTHRISNLTHWGIELAPWALSVMDKGARAIVPNEPFVAHGESYLPARPLVPWKFTDLADERWTFGTKFIQLQQKETCTTPQKIGMFNHHGWAACEVHQQLFIVRYPVKEGQPHTDFGCNTELFTNGDMLEMETLGPLSVIPPGETVEHIEHWGLFDGSAGDTEDEIEAALLACLEQIDAV